MKTPKSNFTEAKLFFQPSISGDIKSLAKEILGNSNLLSSKLCSSGYQNNQSISQCMQRMRCAGDDLISLIDAMAEGRSKQADSAAIKASAVYNLRHELECIRDTFLEDARAKRISLLISIEENIPVAFWDIASLRKRVFNNILSNTIRYVPVGGTISIGARKSDEYTMAIKISYAGSGIPVADSESVFQGNHKCDEDINFSDGFNNALKCIQDHKGTLCIIDEPEFSGAAFNIEIPLYTLCIQ